MLFSVPFYDLHDHLVRCRIENGKLSHVLPPAYHGNPVGNNRSLVFFHPGWRLLDELRDAGFVRVEIGLYYDVYQGIVSNNNPYPDGHMWPIILRCER